MMQFAEWLEGLETELVPMFEVPTVHGGHTYIHVFGMRQLAPKLLKLPEYVDVDSRELDTAVLLHNLDRVKGIEDHGNAEMEEYLGASPFDEAGRDRIRTAVRDHSSLGALNDGLLTKALRALDRLERMGPLGYAAAVAHRGGYLPMYNIEDPFLYAATEENQLSSVWMNVLRMLEWVPMMTPAERTLICKGHLRSLIDFIRATGEEISVRHGIKNQSEVCLEKALGDCYQEFAVAM